MRLLTPREQATICAALRLWIDTPGDAIPESVFAAGAGDDPPLQDADADRLLTLVSTFAVQVAELELHICRQPGFDASLHTCRGCAQASLSAFYARPIGATPTTITRSDG